MTASGQLSRPPPGSFVAASGQFLAAAVTPQNVFVGNGHLTLRTSKINDVWTGAGISNAGSFSQKYGKFVMRARLDAGYSTRATALPWPSGGGWLPEVDFLEISGSDPQRLRNDLTNHYSSANLMEHAKVPR